MMIPIFQLIFIQNPFQNPFFTYTIHAKMLVVILNEPFGSFFVFKHLPTQEKKESDGGGAWCTTITRVDFQIRYKWSSEVRMVVFL